MPEVQEILERFKRAADRKTNWDTLYEDVMEYVAPNREIFSEFVKGQEKNNTDRVFDSTAQNAMSAFVSNLQSSLVPPLKKWINLKAGQSVQRDNVDELNEVLERIVNIVFSFLRISNFDTEISTSFADLAVGVGAISLMKGDIEKPFIFKSIHIAELYLEEGPEGRPDTAFRQSVVKAKNILGQWEDAKISGPLAEKIRDNPDADIKIVEMVTPRRMSFFNTKTNAKEMRDAFEYNVVDQTHGTKIVERKEKFNPWIVFRWTTIPGEVYGRGPAVQALPDIKTLNKTKELILRNASLAVSGAYTVVDEGNLNIKNINIQPGALIPVESNPGGARGASIAPLPRSGDFNVGQIIIKELQESVNKTMFAEPLGRVDLPVKTATEIAFRQQELAKKIGSAFGRLQFELMIPLVNRLLAIMEELFPDAFDGLRVDGQVIDVEYVSPLAQAQEAEEFENILRYAQTITGLFGPEIGTDLMKPTVLSRVIADKLQVPRELVPTEQEFEQIRQAIIENATQLAAQPEGAVA